jgi:hypothetical protein
LRIYFFILLSGDGEGAGWIRFLHDGSVENEDDNYGVDKFLGSVENEGDNYGVDKFLSMMTWRLFFPNSHIKTKMMSPP